MFMLNGKQIRQLRQALGWTQTELAYHMRVTENCVKQWESDRRHPSWKKLVRLNELLEEAKKKHGLVLAS